MEEHDVIVVGAGSAGAALAGRVSERGLQVLLLEAGPDWRSADCLPELRRPWGNSFPDPWSQNALHNSPTLSSYQWPKLLARRRVGSEEYPYLRGRGLGGCSTINGCYAIRPPLEEFSYWEQDFGCDGWGPTDVQPYFARLETDLDFGDAEYHGQTGPIPVMRLPEQDWGSVDLLLREGALAVGHQWVPDCNSPGAFGVAACAFNIRDGVRVTTNDAYLDPARERGNLVISGNTLVDRVLFSGNRAIGVRAHRADGPVDLFASEIVLCAGAPFSPAILQRSGLGPAELLRSLAIPVLEDLPVGQSLQDHAGFALSLRLEGAKQALNDRHGNCLVRYSSNNSASGSGDLVITSHNVGADGHSGGLRCRLNQCFSRGYVAIRSRDLDASPAMNLNLLSDERDLERMRGLFLDTVAILAQPPFETLGGGVTDWNGDQLDRSLRGRSLDQWCLSVVRDTSHLSSSCPIGGPNSSSAVLDPECRVLGAENLRVADLSSAPTVPRANSHLTGVMIGERVADLITGVT